MENFLLGGLGFLIGAISVYIIQNKKIHKLDKENIRLKTENKALPEEKEEWEKNKEKFKEEIRNASLEASKEATNTLLQQNREERNDETKKVEENIEKTTQKIFDGYDTIQKAVSNIYEKSKETQKDSALLQRYLFESAKVGKITEIMLENAVKNMGFEYMWRDYETQVKMATEDGNNTVIPDMIIELPNDKVIIIDSKSTTALNNLINAEENNDEETIKNYEKKLSNAMNKHLKTLKTSGYEQSVQKYLKQKGKNIPFENISFFMWVGHDACLSKIYNADKDFIRTAHSHNIYVVGTSGLYVALGIARQQKRLEIQNEQNYEIINELKTLFTRIAIVSERAKTVSNGLKTANNAWDSLLTAFQGQQGVTRSIDNIQSKGEVFGDKNIVHIPQIKVIKGSATSTTDDNSNESEQKESDDDVKDVIINPATQTESITDQSES